MSTKTRCKLDEILSHPLSDKKRQIVSLASNQGSFDDYRDLYESLPENYRYILCCLIVIDQAENLLLRYAPRKDLLTLFDRLEEIDAFYSDIGGIIGYHLTCLSLLNGEETKTYRGLHIPRACELSRQTKEVDRQILAGISSLDSLVEIYPIGGAADRLAMNQSENRQIAATFEFFKKSLIERLIADVQAREYLHYKLFGKQISLPVLMMISDEKNGASQIKELLEENAWFGKDKEDFYLIYQPLVPALTRSGKWCRLGPGQILFKPGGHGVIWKLGLDSGVLNTLEKRGKTKALVRQINNPIAGTDYGLIAFCGIGFEEDKIFGFASCSQLQGVQEGINVLMEKSEGFSLTNIEYCCMEREQLNGQKKFLANTNLLFVDLRQIPKMLKSHPIPGMLVNAKKIKYKDAFGHYREEEIIRLESTMQNLADALIEEKTHPKSFITSNERKKTISAIKREFVLGSALAETPDQCALDFLENARDLLVNFCHFKVPKMPSPDQFFHKGPSFLFTYHPALGPLYQIIGKKLRYGRLARGSELVLEVAELDVQELDVDGSLHIITEAVMGSFDEKGRIDYSEQAGKCTLRKVKVANAGINRDASGAVYKGGLVYKERCLIYIEEGGEFFAENLSLNGEMRIFVPNGVRVTARQGESGEIELIQSVIKSPSWFWKYGVGPHKEINLTRIRNKRFAEGFVESFK